MFYTWLSCILYCIIDYDVAVGLKFVKFETDSVDPSFGRDPWDVWNLNLYVHPNVCQREIKITWGLRGSKLFTKALKLLSLPHTHRQTNRDTCTSIPHGSNKCTPTSSNLWKPNHHSQYWWWWNQRAYPRNYSLFPRVWASGRINIAYNVSMPKEFLMFQFKILTFLVKPILHYTFDHRCKMRVPFPSW